MDPLATSSYRPSYAASSYSTPIAAASPAPYATPCAPLRPYTPLQGPVDPHNCFGPGAAAVEQPGFFSRIGSAISGLFGGGTSVPSAGGAAVIPAEKGWMDSAWDTVSGWFDGKDLPEANQCSPAVIGRDLSSKSYDNLSLGETATIEGRSGTVVDVRNGWTEGFQAVTVEFEDGTSAIGFAGTTLYSPSDWYSNIRNALGFSAPQYDEALKYFDEMKGAGHDVRVLAGHSLGGGLATYVGAMRGVYTSTVNAAPLGEYYRDQIAGAGADTTYGGVHQFATEGEIVSQRAPGEWLGNTCLAPALNGEELTVNNDGVLNELANHSLYNFDVNALFKCAGVAAAAE